MSNPSFSMQFFTIWRQMTKVSITKRHAFKHRTYTEAHTNFCMDGLWCVSSMSTTNEIKFLRFYVTYGHMRANSMATAMPYINKSEKQTVSFYFCSCIRIWTKWKLQRIDTEIKKLREINEYGNLGDMHSRKMPDRIAMMQHTAHSSELTRTSTFMMVKMYKHPSCFWMIYANLRIFIASYDDASRLTYWQTAVFLLASLEFPTLHQKRKKWKMCSNLCWNDMINNTSIIIELRFCIPT